MIAAFNRNLRDESNDTKTVTESDPSIELFDKFLRLIKQNIRGKKYSFADLNCQTMALNLLSDLGLRDQVLLKPTSFVTYLSKEQYIVDE